MHDGLLDDRSFSRMEGLLYVIYERTGLMQKLTKKIFHQINLMNTTVDKMGALSSE